VREGELRDAVGYVALSLALCLAAVAAGFAGGRIAFAAGGA